MKYRKLTGSDILTEESEMQFDGDGVWWSVQTSAIGLKVGDIRQKEIKFRVVESEKDEKLISNLNELINQWKETAKEIREIDKSAAVAYLECITELQEILNGDLSPIEKW